MGKGIKEPSGRDIINPEKERNDYYARFVSHQYNHSLRTDWLKFIAQILVILIAISISVVATVFLILFIINLLNNIDKYVQIGGIIASLVSYAALIIGLFKIIVDYLFNREDDKNRNALIDNIIKYDTNHSSQMSNTVEIKIDDLSSELTEKDSKK